jgi:hypothetical protein
MRDDSVFLQAQSRERYLIDVFGRAMDRLVLERRRERVIHASRRFGYFELLYQLWSDEFDQFVDALGLKYRWRREPPSRLAARLRRRFPWAAKSDLSVYPSPHKEGAPYRCEKIKALSSGRGCVDFTARNDEEALLTCALIAGSRGWLGGVHSPGRCRDGGHW